MRETTNIKIEKLIYQVRGVRIMLDSDLAEIYGVETKSLNRQVKRNLARFSNEFMFQLTKDEVIILKKSFNSFGCSLGSRKYLPYVFTEYGIAMLSSVLNSDLAVAANISIIKTFIRLRKAVANDENITKKIMKLEKGTDTIFKVIFDKLDEMDDEIIKLKREIPALSSKRKRIGFHEVGKITDS